MSLDGIYVHTECLYSKYPGLKGFSNSVDIFVHSFGLFYDHCSRPIHVSMQEIHPLKTTVNWNYSPDNQIAHLNTEIMIIPIRL